MPLFAYPPAPVLFGADIMLTAATAATAAVTASAVYFSSYTLNATVTITSMRTDFSGTPTGNVDMGIYDATGTNGAPNNLLGHTGANAAANSAFTKNLTSNLTLAPGQYWVAFVDTAADSIPSRSLTATNTAPFLKSTASTFSTLPSTAPANANTNIVFVCFGLIQNSWS